VQVVQFAGQQSCLHAVRHQFRVALHRRSQDFLWGALFPQKVDDLF